MTELEKYITSYFGVTKDDVSKISSFFQLGNIRKGDYFLKSGHVCDKLSFHKSGIMRVYIKSNNSEITQWISSQGYFITDLAGIIFNQPSKYNIQALNDCELYTINNQNYNNLANVIPRWHELEKLFIARCFTMLEDRVYTLLSTTAEERYKLVWEQNPELFNQVPLQYMASMMGMAPETLSRLRKKVKW